MSEVGMNIKKHQAIFVLSFDEAFKTFQNVLY